jgi:hypothetical protein
MKAKFITIATLSVMLSGCYPYQNCHQYRHDYNCSNCRRYVSVSNVYLNSYFIPEENTPPPRKHKHKHHPIAYK